MLKRVKYVVFICFLKCGIIFGQPNDLKFDYITVDNGLSSNEITSIARDSMGYMWFGTASGLNRYNGYEIEVYFNNQNDISSIPNNYITRLHCGPNGDFWVGTINGIARYNYELQNYFTYKTGNVKDPNSTYIVDITNDVYGNIYYANKKGELFRYNNNADTFQIQDIGTNNNTEIGCVFFNEKNVLHIGFINKIGIYRSDTTFFVTVMDDKSDFNLPQVISEFNNEIWISTYPEGVKILKKNNNGFTVKTLEQLQGVFGFGMYNNRDSVLWFPSIAGLYKIDKHKNIRKYTSYFYDDNSLNITALTCIYTDKNQNYWIGTNGGGVNVNLRRKGFNNIKYVPGYENSVSEKKIKSIHNDNRGNLWIGYTTDLDRFNKELTYKIPYSYLEYPSLPNSVTFAFQYYRGNLYLGTYGYGLMQYNYITNGFSRVSIPSNWVVENRDVRSITRNEKWLYLSMHGQGVLKTDLTTTYEVYNKEKNNLITDWTHKVYYDSKDNLWVGTHAGLSVLFSGKDQFINYTQDLNDDSSLANNKINEIYQDLFGNLWVGTSNGLCLYNYEAGTFKIFNTQSGMPFRGVQSILMDDNYYLWVGLKNGLARLDLNDADPFKADLTNRLRVYDVSDGLQSNEFYSASTKMDDGRLVFAGPNGLTYFHPDHIKPNAQEPEVYISNIEIFKEPVLPGDTTSILKKHISVTDKIVLKHNQNFITFELTALSYIQPKKNKYAYFLKGFDGNQFKWIYNGTNRNISYTNLTPGNYTFYYKSANNDDVWSENYKSLEIKVLPPWYGTWVFKFLVFIFMTSIIVFFVRSKSIRIKKQKERELDKMKIKFFMNISHEFRTPLSLILGPVDNIQENINKPVDPGQLQLISRNAKRLLRLVNQLLDMRKLESGMAQLAVTEDDVVQYIRNIFMSFKYLAENQNITYEFETASDNHICSFDPEIIEKTMYNLISNAFKYTPGNGRIRVVMKFTKNNQYDSKNLLFNNMKDDIEVMEISVSDTGIGIDKDKLQLIFERFYRTNDSATKKQSGTGLGLAITKEFIEAHKGKITVKSHKNQGSLFTFYIPVSSEAYEAHEHSSHPDNSGYEEKYPHITNDNKELLINDTAINGDNEEQSLQTISESVLIVDDNPEVVFFIADLFKNSYKIFKAENGEKGLEMANKHIPDIIISDVMMPVMDGIEFCNQIKMNVLTSHIPVILLTAKASDQGKITGLETGADDYITKPFNAKILKIRVSNLLENKRKIIQNYKENSIHGTDLLSKNPVDRGFLKKVHQLVIDNLADSDFNVDALSEKLNMSRSSLFRKFKGLADQNPSEFIKQIKLQYALTQLQTRKFTISEIAWKTGYKDVAHFTKSFKKEFGKAPSQYLK